MKRSSTHSWLMRAIIFAMLASGPSCGFAEQVVAEPPSRIERAVQAMGTTLRLAVEAVDRAAALAASERALRALEEAESRISTWRQDSELSRLNHAPLHEPVTVSRPLANDLAVARWCSEQTAGAFDPTIGALIEVWGLRTGGRQPSAAELAHALAATGMAGLDLEDRLVRRRTGGLQLEEGGFGKGVGLAAAMTALAADSKVSSAWLDFGGQLAVLGVRVTEGAWRVELADPRDRGRSILEIELPSPDTDAPRSRVSLSGVSLSGVSRPGIGSLATSGNSERRVSVDGQRIGHLLDPRTGHPAPDFGSMTVWAADPVIADCLSTGLYVLGPEAALAWAASAPGIEALAIVESGDRLFARATPGFAGRIRVLVDDLEIEILAPGLATKPRAGELPQHKALPLRPQTNSAGTSPHHS